MKVSVSGSANYKCRKCGETFSSVFIEAYPLCMNCRGEDNLE